MYSKRVGEGRLAGKCETRHRGVFGSDQISKYTGLDRDCQNVAKQTKTRQMNKQTDTGCYNPGSLGQTRDASQEIQVIPNGSQTFCSCISSPWHITTLVGEVFFLSLISPVIGRLSHMLKLSLVFLFWFTTALLPFAPRFLFIISALGSMSLSRFLGVVIVWQCQGVFLPLVSWLRSSCFISLRRVRRVVLYFGTARD